jgi:hypothetical protein
MKIEMHRLENSGRWASGPTDLLTIAKRSHDELVHSNVLAWLLTPAALHRLGTSLLEAILDKTWDTRIEPDWPVRVGREVRRSDAERFRIADIVVDAGPIRLVIENKVHSPEGLWQCEDLYWLWTAHHSDDLRQPERVLFVLLSLHGRLPESVRSEEAIAAWRPLDHAWIANWIRGHLSEIPGVVARSSATQYLISLQRVQRRV